MCPLQGQEFQPCRVEPYQEGTARAYRDVRSNTICSRVREHRQGREQEPVTPVRRVRPAMEARVKNASSQVRRAGLRRERRALRGRKGGGKSERKMWFQPPRLMGAAHPRPRRPLVELCGEKGLRRSP